MTIEKNSRFCSDPTDYSISCDYGKSKNCVVGFEADDTDFSTIVASLRNDNWQVFKDEAGEWNHICPACKEEKKKLALKTFSEKAREQLD